jgi:hypothetical protein
MPAPAPDTPGPVASAARAARSALSQRPWLVFAVVAVAYHLNGGPIVQIDCIPAPYVAWSILRHGDFDLSRYPDALGKYRVVGGGSLIRELPDGRWLSRYPPGSAVAALPVLVPFALFHEEPPAPKWMRRLGKLAAALYTAGAVALFGRMVSRLAPSAALPATALLAFGTCLWTVAAQALWQHGPAVFFVMAGFHALLSAEAAPASPAFPSFLRSAWAGLMLGAGAAVRPTAALFGGAAGVAALVRGRWAEAAGLAAGAALPVGLTMLYNRVHFSDAAMGGYGGEAGAEGWSTPLWLGLSGLLTAPSRGLLVHSPALLLVPAGLWALLRNRDLPGRTLILAWSAAGAGLLVSSAMWYAWWGGWCFGPRLILEAMPVGCLLFALGLERAAPSARRVWVALVGLSVFIHAVGILGDQTEWYERHHLLDGGRSLFGLTDTQFEAFLRRLLRMD